MKKLKNFWLNIPRPIRTGLNLLAILVLLSTFYYCIGSPPLNMIHALRRAERSHMVGPSTILFDERVDDYEYGRLILAETDYGVITYVDDSQFGFNYHEKTGDITVVAAPKWWFDWGHSDWSATLPVFVVHDYPEATHAWLMLDIKGAYTHSLNGELLNEPLNHTPSLHSSQGGDGYFYFTLDLPYQGEESNQDGAGGPADDGYAMDMLAQHFTNFWNNCSPHSNASITATVLLYDENDSLIAQREIVLRTMTEEAE